MSDKTTEKCSSILSEANETSRMFPGMTAKDFEAAKNFALAASEITMALMILTHADFDGEIKTEETCEKQN